MGNIKYLNYMLCLLLCLSSLIQFNYGVWFLSINVKKGNNKFGKIRFTLLDMVSSTYKNVIKDNEKKNVSPFMHF